MNLNDNDPLAMLKFLDYLDDYVAIKQRGFDTTFHLISRQTDIHTTTSYPVNPQAIKLLFDGAKILTDATAIATTVATAGTTAPAIASASASASAFISLLKEGTMFAIEVLKDEKNHYKATVSLFPNRWENTISFFEKQIMTAHKLSPTQTDEVARIITEQMVAHFRDRELNDKQQYTIISKRHSIKDNNKEQQKDFLDEAYTQVFRAYLNLPIHKQSAYFFALWKAYNKDIQNLFPNTPPIPYSTFIRSFFVKAGESIYDEIAPIIPKANTIKREEVMENLRRNAQIFAFREMLIHHNLFPDTEETYKDFAEAMKEYISFSNTDSDDNKAKVGIASIFVRKFRENGVPKDKTLKIIAYFLSQHDEPNLTWKEFNAILKGNLHPDMEINRIVLENYAIARLTWEKILKVENLDELIEKVDNHDTYIRGKDVKVSIDRNKTRNEVIKAHIMAYYEDYFPAYLKYGNNLPIVINIVADDISKGIDPEHSNHYDPIPSPISSNRAYKHFIEEINGARAKRWLKEFSNFFYPSHATNINVPETQKQGEKILEKLIEMLEDDKAYIIIDKQTHKMKNYLIKHLQLPMMDYSTVSQMPSSRRFRSPTENKLPMIWHLQNQHIRKLWEQLYQKVEGEMPPTWVEPKRRGRIH
jgi:hypothetical protein